MSLETMGISPERKANLQSLIENYFQNSVIKGQDGKDVLVDNGYIVDYLEQNQGEIEKFVSLAMGLNRDIGVEKISKILELLLQYHTENKNRGNQ